VAKREKGNKVIGRFKGKKEGEKDVKTTDLWQTGWGKRKEKYRRTRKQISQDEGKE